MKINNSRRFAVKHSTGQLFMRVRYSTGEYGSGSIYVDFSVGCKIDVDKWDAEKQRPVRGSVHGSRSNAVYDYEINKLINRFEEAVDTAFKIFELEERVPSAEEFRREVNENLNRVDEGLRTERPKQTKTFDRIIEAYKEYGRDIKGWSDASWKKITTIQNNFNAKFPNVMLASVDVAKLREFQVHLTNKGYRNRSVNDTFKLLRTFFKWCEAEGIELEHRLTLYNPDLPDTEDEVVFLEWDEFKRLAAYEFSKKKRYLESARDVFIFQCATGLRYSDLKKLKRSHIFDGKIHANIKKTRKPVIITLNEFSAGVLNKYADITFGGDLALPVISNQKQNEYVKDACELAGIDSPVIRTAMYGQKYKETVYKKFEVISTHTARRTFISISLSLGASQEQVMQITGHTSVKQMERYVGLSGADKAKATTIWDEQEISEEEKARQHLLEKLSKLSLEELQAVLTDK